VLTCYVQAIYQIKNSGITWWYPFTLCLSNKYKTITYQIKARLKTITYQIKARLKTITYQIKARLNLLKQW